MTQLWWQTWRVSKGHLRVTDDASPGEWIAPRLGGGFGAVTRTVPTGYAAYARICHPASHSNDDTASWPEVAEATGRIAHPLMQWHALVGSSDPFNFRGSLWPGGDPSRGDLAPESLEVLCEILATQMADADDCYVGFWVGWAWVHGGGSRTRLDGSGTKPVTTPIPAAFSASEISRSRLVHPNDREYVTLAGPLSAVRRLSDSGLGGSPNLLWPAERAWFVASEIDFDSTLGADLVTWFRPCLMRPDSTPGPSTPRIRSPQMPTRSTVLSRGSRAASCWPAHAVIPPAEPRAAASKTATPGSIPGSPAASRPCKAPEIGFAGRITGITPDGAGSAWIGSTPLSRSCFGPYDGPLADGRGTAM
jgi:hypothetical protein